MQHYKSFIFNAGESPDDIDSVVNKWLGENKADIISTNSSISARPDSTDVCAVMITLVHEIRGPRGKLRRS